MEYTYLLLFFLTFIFQQILEVMVWTSYIAYDRYEINTKYPYAMRDKQTLKPIGAYHYDGMTWETLKGYSRYEINVQYPHYVRDKQKLNIIAIYVESNGYYRLNLQPDDKQHTPKPYQHDLIAKQWLYNDDVEHKAQVDHINRDRLDNHIYNLRWSTPSENNANKKGFAGDVYKFTSELAYDTSVEFYYDDEIEDLYIMDDEYYILIKDKYVRLIKQVDKNNRQCIYIYNANCEIVRMYLDDVSHMKLTYH